PYIRYDYDGHLRYIHFIVRHGRIPQPNEGWEFFQAPLFYLISSVAYVLLRLGGIALPHVDLLIRILPVLCGIGSLVIVIKVARLMFPQRAELQVVAVLIGAMIPMNLYMYVPVSNEPLAGVLGCAIVLACLRMMSSQSDLMRQTLVLGALLGLAILTKVTA